MTITEKPARAPLSLQHPTVRFVIVGVANTLIDLGILLVLTQQGVVLFWANLVSTSCGLVFSFLVNRRFTFRANGSKPIWRQALEFAAVTLFGLWLLQPPIITGVAHLIGPLDLSSELTLLVGKACATCVTIVWNYVLYSRFVFRQPGERRS